LAMFRGDARAEAVAVPFMYGMYEGIFLLIYCIVVWKVGWTKAPTDVSFFKMLFTSYEVLSSDGDEVVVDGPPNPKDVDEPAPDDYYMIDPKDIESPRISISEPELPHKN